MQGKIPEQMIPKTKNQERVDHTVGWITYKQQVIKKVHPIKNGEP